MTVTDTMVCEYSAAHMVGEVEASFIWDGGVVGHVACCQKCHDFLINNLGESESAFESA